ncbi:hypothetical protein OG216_46410 (plasmid) [Streptomycetaceae bacterium NBC_01309]
MKKIIPLAFAAVVAVPAMLLVGSEASATDGAPCHAVSPRTGGQVCPDWSPTGSIPVFSSPYVATTAVGYIASAGEDWYMCQMQTGYAYTLNGHKNNWWAKGYADNNVIGWIPQTYFKGGQDFEGDANLKPCETPAPEKPTNHRNNPKVSPETHAPAPTSTQSPAEKPLNHRNNPKVSPETHAPVPVEKPQNFRNNPTANPETHAPAKDPCTGQACPR